MILVDALRQWPGARRPFQNGSCHLVSDESLDELHAFAEQLGLKRQWFQDKRIPHYDLTPSKRRLAIQNGATEVTDKEFMARCLRAKIRSRR